MKIMHLPIKRLEAALRAGAALLLCLAWPLSVPAALLDAWSLQQTVQVPQSGIVRLELPPTTLDAARAQLEDLRLTDASGHEIAYVIKRIVPSRQMPKPVRSLTPKLGPDSSTILLETGTEEPIDTLWLDLPNTVFIKAAHLEGSQDGRTWTDLGEGHPLYRQPDGTAATGIGLNRQSWAWLRVTLDDRRSPPVPVTGARLRLVPSTLPPAITVPVKIKARDELPGETRLTLDLGSAHLTLANLEIISDELLYNRTVKVSTTEIVEGELREQVIASDSIYRSGNTSRQIIPLERPVASRELVLRIRNQDSPPLTIREINVKRWPVEMVFQAPQAGSYTVYVGNRQCPAPHYDIASLDQKLDLGQAARVTPGPLSANPQYHAPEALAGLTTAGAPIDSKPWEYVRPLQFSQSGVQQLELDADVLAHAQPDLADLRLIFAGKQIPYLVEHTSLVRNIEPVVRETKVDKQPTLTRWTLRLPNARLPVTRLIARSSTPVFQRDIRVWEELSDRQGSKYGRELGTAHWVQSPDQLAHDLLLTLNSTPETDTLLLETDNGDNPPLQLSQVRLTLPVTRLVFKTDAGQSPSLYYGNPQATTPRYDLSLVAGQLAGAEKISAHFAPGQTAPRPVEAESSASTQTVWLFWGVLSLVVVVLLILIARLLPKTPEGNP